MKPVFVDPPSPPGFVAFRHAHGGYGEMCRTSRLKIPTLDIFHCASLVLENGFPAGLVDAVVMDLSISGCADSVLGERPDLIALRTASGSSPQDLRLAERLRAGFDGPIVFFGPQAAVEAESLLASSAVDAVVIGEAPPVFLDIARRGGFQEVPGVSYKTGGEIVRNPPAPPIADLDILPVPRWDLVPYRKYSYLTAQTSWGCPVGCRYCPYPVTQGARWRARSVGGVVREFRTLKERYHPPFVNLRDPYFSFDRRRTLELCRALSAAGAPVLWGCETRLESLDEELIRRMAEAGCMRVEFGVESVRPEVLRRVGRKPLSPTRIKRVVGLLKRYRMLTYALYMLGLPGETARSTNETIDFALELDTNAAAFSAATPFPGTGLESMARAEGRIAAVESLHLTSCIPAMGNESMDAGEIAELYRTAKARWKEHKTPRVPVGAL